MVNHSLAAKLATDLLLLRSLGRMFSYRKFTSSMSLSRIRALCFFNDNLLFCNRIEHDLSFFYSSLKLNSVHAQWNCSLLFSSLCKLKEASMVLKATSAIKSYT